MRAPETLRLAGFFGALAIKEHVRPSLHVRPLVAELFLTDNCNLRCVSCACWRSNTKDELSMAEWQNVLDQLVAMRMYKVNFTGGEPLLRKDAVDIIGYGKQAGIRHIHLNSNAILLTPDKVDAVIAAGQTFLFRHQAVSDETHVASAELADALGELDALAREDRRWLPRFSDLRYIPRHFDDLVQPDLPCAESQLKLMIHSRGEIGGCWRHDPDMSVRDTPIRDVVDSPKYRAQHEKLFRKECVGCGSNYSLNLRRRPGTYAQDLMWKPGRRDLRSEVLAVQGGR